MIDYIEANIGCKVSDAFVIHDKQETLVKYEQFLQSRGVPCEFMFYNEDRCELFVPKSERKKALDLLSQLKNQNHERDNQSNTQQKTEQARKPKPRI